nr:MAG TPA: hypothetical protein [Caudoviricetes sp.]DAY95355.1 MAG TPA: hypothetical protein [Caudoviricetes sp.]
MLGRRDKAPGRALPSALQTRPECRAVTTAPAGSYAGVYRSLHGVLFGRNWGPSPAYVPGCAARPCARLRPLTYATARLRYEATLHGEP